ncbi:hypothetical protein GQ600_16622 [Phytophthora cactorum]|nr:hypothetical protein GQ600_16622 [Phytophthora cactorum]
MDAAGLRSTLSTCFCTDFSSSFQFFQPWSTSPRKKAVTPYLYFYMHKKLLRMDDAEVGITHRNSGIPALVIFRPGGEVLDFHGRKRRDQGAGQLANYSLCVRAFGQTRYNSRSQPG